MRDEWFGDAVTNRRSCRTPTFGFVCPVLQTGVVLG